MSVAFVRSTENRVSTGSVSSMTLSISASSGQFVAVFGFPSGGSSSTPVSSISDTGGNTWAIPGSYGSTNPPAEYTGGSGCFIAYTNVGTALTSVTVNIPTANELTVCVAVFSGVKSSFPFDQGAVGISTSTPTLSSLAGDLVLGIANTSNASSISGMSTLTTDHGNCAGYGIPGGNENVTMSWSPSQNAPAGIAEFLVGPTVVNGTATLTDAESLTADATIAPIATLVENESLTAVPGANPHIQFSGVTANVNDSNGIPLVSGLTSYFYTSTTVTAYTNWMSLKDGKLQAGPVNGAADSALIWNGAGEFEFQANVVFTGFITATSGTITNPTLITTDSWHSVTPNTGWTLTSQNPPLSYRLLPDGNAQLVGSIKFSSGTPSSGAIMCTLPTAYRPINGAFYLTPTASDVFLITVATNGNVTITNWAGFTLGATPSVYINFIYPLNL